MPNTAKIESRVDYTTSFTILPSCTGEEVAFYFGWMDFYSTCILIPLILGLVMYLVRGQETTVDTDPYLPLFSVFMAIWAVLFLVVRLVICSI